MPRKTMVWATALLIFVVGIPSMLSQGSVSWLSSLSFYQGRDFLTLVADMCDIALMVGGCLMCVFIAYLWKVHNMNEELEKGNESFRNSFLQRYISFMIMYVCPYLLGILSLGVIIDKFYVIDILFGG